MKRDHCTPGPLRTPRAARRRALWRVLLTGWAASAALAQVPPHTADEQAPRVLLNGSERMLWVMQAQADTARVFHRGPASPFDLGTPVTGHVLDLFSGGEDALILLSDRSIWRYGPNVQLLERILPGRARPWHLAAHRGRLTALVLSEAAASLPRLEPNGSPPDAASQPFEPRDSHLSLAVEERDRGWRGWVACPPEARLTDGANLGPRLLAAGDYLFLACLSPEREDQLLSFLLDESALRWIALDPVSAPGISGFWATTLSRVPALVVAAHDARGNAGIAAYRRLGDPRAPAAGWQAATLTLSPLPDGVAALRYEGAVGFNQSLALLTLDGEDEWRLRFAGIDGPPAEDTVPLSTVLARHSREGRLHMAIQMATLLLLLGLITCFVIFRRNSMMQPLPLPQGVAPAFVFQRAAAGLIDLGLFAIPLSIVLDVPWRDGFSSLAAWGMFGGPNLDIPYRALYWWTLSAGGYMVYSFLLELITRRTLGKAIAGIRIIAEDGRPPRAWQIALRSALRLIELMPQFWMLAVLVLVSRNRQRLGDIFARTLVIRHVESNPDDRKTDSTDEPGDADGR